MVGPLKFGYIYVPPTRSLLMIIILKYFHYFSSMAAVDQSHFINVLAKKSKIIGKIFSLFMTKIMNFYYQTRLKRLRS